MKQSPHGNEKIGAKSWSSVKDLDDCTHGVDVSIPQIDEKMTKAAMDTYFNEKSAHRDGKRMKKSRMENVTKCEIKWAKMTLVEG